jgi:uncharacterized protein (DUF2384 family)
MATVWDYLTAINSTKKDITEEGTEGYVPFVINRTLSYFADTVFQANEVNQHHHLPHNAQFQYLLNTCTRRKRFTKWIKKDDDTRIRKVSQVMNINQQRAREVVSLLSVQQLEDLLTATHEGGRV